MYSKCHVVNTTISSKTSSSQTETRSHTRPLAPASPPDAGSELRDSGDLVSVGSQCHWAVSSGSGRVGARVRGRPAGRGTLLPHSPAGGHGPLPPLAAVHVLVQEPLASGSSGRMPRAKRCGFPGTRTVPRAAPFYTPAALGPKGSYCPTSCHTGSEVASPGFGWHLPGDQRGRPLVPLLQGDVCSCPCPV